MSEGSSGILIGLRRAMQAESSPQFDTEHIGQLLHPLIRLLDSLTADEIRNQVVYLQRFGAQRPRHIRETLTDYAADMTPV